MEKLPHVRSPSYRTAVIDLAVCVHLAQGLLDRLLISLTRLEVITTVANSHTFRAHLVNGARGLCNSLGVGVP